MEMIKDKRDASGSDAKSLCVSRPSWSSKPFTSDTNYSRAIVLYSMD